MNGNFSKLTAANDLKKGVLDGLMINTDIEDGALCLISGRTDGTCLSEIMDVPAFEYLVASWNCDTPLGTWIELSVRAYVDKKGVWSEFLSWGKFSQSIQRENHSHSDGTAGIDVDEFYICKKDGETASRIQFQIHLHSDIPHITPNVRLVAATLKNTKIQPIPVCTEFPAADLSIPLLLDAFPYSQNRRDLVDFIQDYSSIGGSICSMTTITGMLNRLGENILPEELAMNFIDFAYGFGNWAYSVAAASEFGYEAYVRYGSPELIYSELAAGYAVGVSVKYTNSPEKASESIPYVENTTCTTAGHLVLIRGYFMDDDGILWIYVNDSASDTDDHAFRKYRADEFLTGYTDEYGHFVKPAWSNHVCYIIHNKVKNAGASPIKHIPALLKEVPASHQCENLREYSVFVNDTKLPLPDHFTEKGYKDKKVQSGGVITITLSFAETSPYKTIYKTLAQQPSVYGTTVNGHILFDYQKLLSEFSITHLPEDGTLTAYICVNSGITYVAQLP